MINLDAKSEGFKFQYEKFLIACDALEDGGEWNKLAHGEMDTYYFNDLMCAVLKLISADGRFTDEEADYVNSLLGFNYTVEELAEVYMSEKENIDTVFTDGIEAGYKQMKKDYPKLAEHYKNMLLQLCDLIIASDGQLEERELRGLEELKKDLS